MASVGLPIDGDPLYPKAIDVGPDDFGQSLALLAYTLEFDDPITGTHRRFVSSARGLAAGFAAVQNSA